MNDGVLAKIRKWIIRLAWVPLLFGVAGYHFVGDTVHGTMGFLEAVYATIALYFMNPDSDISNVYVLAAKFTSFLVVADVMFAVFEALHNSLRHIVSNRFSDSTAVYTDNQDWARVITDYWKHSYLGEPERHPEKLEKAKNHILMFEDDMKNLEIYNRCQKNLSGKDIYVMLNHTDPFLVKKLDNPHLKYFNIYEMMARKFWKDHDIYDEIIDNVSTDNVSNNTVSDMAADGIEIDGTVFSTVGDDNAANRKNGSYEGTYRIAITDFGAAGEALFRYGFINNVYSSKQHIEYHIWGAEEHQRSFLQEINKKAGEIEGCDDIIVHDGDPIDGMDILGKMSRIIISKLEDRELLQELLHRRVEADIYYFSDRSVNLDEIYRKKVISFGQIKDILTEEYLRQDILSRQGMLFNYDYKLRSEERNAPADYENEMREAWAELDGFLKGSNLARADHYWIEKKLLDEGKADIREICIIEHNRWCRYHLINRWIYGESRDKVKGIHPLLVSFDELSKEEQDKDDIYDPVIKKEIERLI